MKIHDTALPDVKLFEPQVFGDDRGFFLESFHQKRFNEALKKEVHFVQDNHSYSSQGVLRGLHYQLENPQGKLIRILSGEVYDVAVDMRKDSPTFGKWAGFNLSAKNKLTAWIPAGFAHGFLVLSETADFLYKCTDYYNPKADRCLIWNDPTVGITWPEGVEPLLSPKDAAGSPFLTADYYEGPELL